MKEVKSLSNKSSAISETGSVVYSQPSCSFQSIWSRLNNEDLTEQKVEIMLLLVSGKFFKFRIMLLV